MLNELFYFLIFPGLAFSSVVGGFLSWFDRKITARVQFRKGPPLLQPFYDFVKLLTKETILPEKGAKATFLLAPIFSLFGVTMASVFIFLPMFHINTGFSGDIIVILYLLTIPSLTYMIGALASANPLASVGASREMKLIISYELTFLLVLLGLVAKSGFSIKLHDIIYLQNSETVFIGSISGVIAFIAILFVVQAKLCLVPFDMSEAETEIVHGVFIEYSGSAYAIIKLTRYMMLFALPAFVVALFMGGFNFGGIHWLWSVLKVLLVVLLVTLIRNTNPRVKIKQAMKFFFVWMNLLAVVALVLAIFGY